MRRAPAVVLLCALAWAAPVRAFAAGAADAEAVSEMVGVAALAAAAVLLVSTVGLQRVARGSAIADNISYVVGACVCLGASVLVRWVARLVPRGLAEAQAALSSEVLTLVAVVLFSVYFLRVGAALRRFLNVAEASECELAKAQAGEAPGEAADQRGDTVEEGADG